MSMERRGSSFQSMSFGQERMLWLWKHLWRVLSLCFMLWAFPVAGQMNDEPNSIMSIEIKIGEVSVKAQLADNAAARDFVAMLPLQLTLKDYAQTEKVSDLPKSLNTSDSPDGYKAVVGDITYYAPWGNLAIFTKDFSYASGLVYLGKITSGVEHLKKSGPLSVTIRKAE